MRDGLWLRQAMMALLVICVVNLLLLACNAQVQSAPSPSYTEGPLTPMPTLPPMPALNPNDVVLGQQLYAQHCAECHGVDLQGQADWKKPLPNGKYPAPPHDNSGHTWHHGDELLLAVIANGGDGDGNMEHGDMPAFKDKLSEQDMRAVLEFLKSRWAPEHREYQWRMTVQEAQEP